MDGVTDVPFCIEMGRLGGLGVINLEGIQALAKQLPVTIIAPTFEQWELGEMFPDCYFEPVDETLLVVKPN